LPVGSPTFAVGVPGPNGTLSAWGVAAVQPVPQPSQHMNVEMHMHMATHIHVKNCSPNSITNALALAP
jgi:hypothetical protein